jgi:hypothetical protein
MEEAGPSGRVSVVDASGAPVPLHPALVTLALLPRSQWQGLVHLDAIKVCHLDVPNPPTITYRATLLWASYIDAVSIEKCVAALTAWAIRHSSTLPIC